MGEVVSQLASLTECNINDIIAGSQHEGIAV